MYGKGPPLPLWDPPSSHEPLVFSLFEGAEKRGNVGVSWMGERGWRDIGDRIVEPMFFDLMEVEITCLSTGSVDRVGVGQEPSDW